MAHNAYTFIIVPDASSQCRRYTISRTVLYILGVTGMVVLIVASILIHTMLGEYQTVSKKVKQLEKLQRISVSQRNILDRYEKDIALLGQNLSHIKQLNGRLMILTGMDPEEGENNLGLGGPEEDESKSEAEAE
jgi:hypothetical protein